MYLRCFLLWLVVDFAFTLWYYNRTYASSRGYKRLCRRWLVCKVMYAGGIMGRVGGEGKSVSFARKKFDFKFRKKYRDVDNHKGGPGLKIRPGSKNYWQFLWFLSLSTLILIEYSCKLHFLKLQFFHCSSLCCLSYWTQSNSKWKNTPNWKWRSQAF